MRGVISFLCAAVLLLCSSAAYAADMVDVPDAPPPADASVANGFHDWSGAYVGATAGYQIGSVMTRTTTGNFAGVTDLSGFLGGLNAGYNFQSGSMVYGVEGDVNWSNYSGSRQCVADATVKCGYSIDLSGSLRGRFGVSIDQMLLFGTAGVSAGRGTTSISPATAGLTGQSTATLLGITFGAGAEYALTQTISVKAQYDYVNWSERTTGINTISSGAPYTGFPSTHAVKFGLNYKF